MRFVATKFMAKIELATWQLNVQIALCAWTHVSNECLHLCSNNNLHLSSKIWSKYYFSPRPVHTLCKTFLQTNLLIAFILFMSTLFKHNKLFECVLFWKETLLHCRIQVKQQRNSFIRQKKATFPLKLKNSTVIFHKLQLCVISFDEGSS